MPTIAFFYGMLIEMFWRDHPPPHFHVTYQEFRAVINIETGDMLHGRLPPGARRDLQRWTERHRLELLANWERARLQQPLWPVRGADEDD
ncbi:MAG TPA: DUF4160 domain-containing protein [Rhizobiaceae bacterium]|nr:DUF4160 domain-containing protein [Rhizobiaceae bacterium]